MTAPGLEGVEKFEGGYLRRLDNGRTIYLIPQIFNFRLAIGWTHEEDIGYDDFYCYLHEFQAVVAFLTWKGEGDPVIGWIRHGRSGRRRPDGDPDREYVES